MAIQLSSLLPLSPPFTRDSKLAPLSIERKSRRRLAAVGVVLVLLVLLFHPSSTPSLPPVPPDVEAAFLEHRQAASTSRLKSLWTFDDPVLPRAIHGDKVNFTTYLDYHFPPSAPNSPHIIITLADQLFSKTGAANLHNFLEQLNDERRYQYGGEKRESKLVTLCLDDECVDECDRRGMYGYGGFERTRPEVILKATWPKLASLIENLPHRDVFFVDSDVFFARDPFPHMEPLMEEFDVVISENFAYAHANTGWMWLRKSNVTAAAWQSVLDMDMKEVSRDQVNFNTVLGTAKGRYEGEEPWLQPLASNFTAENGLNVHVLDARLFRTYHQRDVPFVGRHDSLYLHSTCCEDAWTKLFVAKDEGFYSDLDHYYSRPPLLLSIEHLTASRSHLEGLFRILLTASHYTSRALLLPSHTTILSLPLTPFSPTPLRQTHSAFPLAQLSNPNNSLGVVPVVESAYVEHATRWLMGVSVLGSKKRRRGDGWWEGLGSRERERREAKALELTTVVDIDMRQHPTLASLLTSLLTDPSFSSAAHVRLVNFDDPLYGTHWRNWTFPAALDRVGMCELEHMPGCDAVCRGGKEAASRGEEEWPSWEEMVATPAE